MIEGTLLFSNIAFGSSSCAAYVGALGLARSITDVSYALQWNHRF